MRVIAGLLLLAASGSALAMHDCKFSAERNLDIDSAGLKSLQLILGSSDAHVDGVAGLKGIEVRGKACASDQDRLKDLTVSQERSGDRVTVSAQKDHGGHMNWFGSSYAYLTLEVRMPAELLAQIEAGSGDARVSNVAALRFESGSGDLNASHIASALTLKVGSGDAIIDDVGSIGIERVGSGDIRATRIRGEATVGHVGSGDLSFSDVKGGVRVESVGSGDLNVDHAGGDIEIGRIGSGDVTVANVAGSFIVHSAGSGDLRHRNVTGKIDVPSRHAFD
jgi:DUF4097 and DUF4098 domain-containing protein YvlB